MKALATALKTELEQWHKFVLVTVWEQDGSAPRGAGARMLVRPNGSIRGTVGGGRFEADAIKTAVSMLEKNSSNGIKLEYVLTGSTDRDMICGGNISLLLEPFAETPVVMNMLDGAVEAEKNNQPYVFVTKSSEESELGLFVVERFVFFADKSGKLFLSEALSDLQLELKPETLRSACPVFFKKGQSEYVAELMGVLHTLYIFGAGHVSTAVAKVAALTGFRCVIIDDRAEFANKERFPYAASIEIPVHMIDYMHGCMLGPKDGVLIITRGHAHDQDILEQCAECGAGYVGMIGSKSKKSQVYANLVAKGIKQESLLLVHSPIGVGIHAETPEEIAVSIVAELIAWRNGKK